MKVVCVVSGGMDSVTMLYHAVKDLKREVTVLSFDYGQKHRKELRYAKWHADKLGLFQVVLDLSFMKTLKTSALTNTAIAVPTMKEVLGEPQPVTYVPFRNAIMMSIAGSVAEDVSAEELYYGIQAHDLYQYWDTDEQFLESMQSVFDLNRKHQIQICAPFLNKSKGDIIHEGRRLHIDYSKTWSCYQGGLLACRRCPTCCERLKGFADNHIRDPLLYELDIK